jgi:hypothetical protein
MFQLPWKWNLTMLPVHKLLGEPTKKGQAGMWPHIAFFVGWFRQQ